LALTCWRPKNPYAGAKKLRVRKDLMKMLGIMREQGIAGVREGIKSGAFLPALAGAVLLPHLVRAPAPAPSSRRDSIN
jgi:hypothetical protein